jgi:hypothetical protein
MLVKCCFLQQTEESAIPFKIVYSGGSPFGTGSLLLDGGSVNGNNGVILLGGNP